MYFILYWLCISYFYFVGVHNTPKNGVHGVRRNYIPKRCVIYTIVLTVYKLHKYIAIIAERISNRQINVQQVRRYS